MTEDRKALLKDIRQTVLALDEDDEGTLSPEESRRVVVRSECGKVIAVLRVLAGAERQAVRALRNGVVDQLLRTS